MMVVDKDLRNIMQIVDKNKHNMSDGDYVKACRSIKEVHKKLKEVTILDIRIPVRGCIGFFMASKGLIHITRVLVSRNRSF